MRVIVGRVIREWREWVLREGVIEGWRKNRERRIIKVVIECIKGY